MVYFGQSIQPSPRLTRPLRLRAPPRPGSPLAEIPRPISSSSTSIAPLPVGGCRRAASILPRCHPPRLQRCLPPWFLPAYEKVHTSYFERTSISPHRLDISHADLHAAPRRFLQHLPHHLEISHTGSPRSILVGPVPERILAARAPDRIRQRGSSCCWVRGPTGGLGGLADIALLNFGSALMRSGASARQG